MVGHWGLDDSGIPFLELLHLFLGFLVLEQEHFLDLQKVESVGALDGKPRMFKACWIKGYMGRICW